MKLRSTLTILALATASFGTVAHQKSMQIWSAGFGPSKEIKIKNPKFVWQVWPEGEGKITGASFVINGKEVDAKYDNRKKELFFESGESLPPGTYNVVAHVQIDDWAKFDKKWTVTIRADAVQHAEDAPADTKQIIAVYNRIRTDHGFGPCRFDPSFNLAAIAHTNYLSMNKGGGHIEDPAFPGYTGMEAADRARVFGHVGSSFEVVATGAQNAAEGITSLWDAPYHRISMMKPGIVFAGASFKGGNLTMDGDGMELDGMFVSPPENGNGVSPSWENHESPNPTRNFDDATETVGYPVVATVYGDKIGKISLVSASLTNALGQEVERYELSPANDNHLKTSVIIIPKKPLAPGNIYSVSIKVKDSLGKLYSKAWKFATRADD